MTYTALEQSVESGSPIELYEFVQTYNFNTVTHRVASCADYVTHNGNVYAPSSIVRGSLNITEDIFKGTLKFDFPRGDSFAGDFMTFPPESTTLITIYRGHQYDNDFIIYWKGRVIGASASDNTITLEAESVFSSIKRQGLRAKYETTCRHVLYSPECAVNMDAYKSSAVVNLINGSEIKVSGIADKPDGYFTNGFVLEPLSGVSRHIISHVTDTLVISRPFGELALSSSVYIYPGCQHTMDECKSKFNNLDNYGGFPFIPIRNPFDGSSII